MHISSVLNANEVNAAFRLVAKKCQNQCCFQQSEISHLAYLYPVSCEESCAPTLGMFFNTSPRLLVKILSR